MAKLPELPASVAAEIAAANVERAKYSVGEKTKVFTCKTCGANCSAAERTEVATGQRFYACGACDTVAEVL
jgi:predicted SprT family Zn-dependent metalloprotease